MSVWSFVPGTHSPALHGSQGELVSVSVTVEPRDLEDFLEALAALDFPINPQIYHADINAPASRTVVEFPAYANRLPHVQAAVDSVSGATVSAKGMLAEIHSH